MAGERKRSVIARLRQADRWLDVNGGAPLSWVRELLRDAAQELESESGSLWWQTMTRPDGHVRIFVHGPFGVREMDVLLETLKLSRQWMERDAQEAATKEAAVDPPVDSNTGKPSTRDARALSVSGERRGHAHEPETEEDAR